jgi:hypothetical protein
MAVAAWILGIAVGASSGSDFGWARIRAAARGEPYGAVTFRPFSSGRGAIMPLWILVEPGDFSKPWLRAKHVAQVLPKAVALMIDGEVVKVGADADGNPALFVGPAGRAANRGDLHVVSVLPGDVQRFRREKGETRRLGASSVAKYWKMLLEDLVSVFVRFPLNRAAKIADELHLAQTPSGVQLKKIILEVGVLLRYEDLTVEKAAVTQVKAKTLEVLDAMTQEQWARLADLAFRMPAEVEQEKDAKTLPPPLPEDEETAPPPAAVPLYVEPDRSVWPGGSAKPPTDDALKTSGENSTKGGVDDSGSDVVVTP